MKKQVIGIDLGGTKISAGIVSGDELNHISSKKITTNGSVEEVLEDLFSVTDELMNNTVIAIGIGVPGLVDTERGMVYDVMNIPSWQEVPLQKLMQDRYHVPVYINNDANCFALGEYYFGKGKGYNSVIGLTVGTGLGAGLILNKKLFIGKNFGAGEFGMIDYMDHVYEYYASGQYFNNVYGIDGEIVFQNAKKGDAEALRMYEEMGTHLGNAIKTIIYALNVELIVLGGSVRHAYPYFSKTMWQQIKTCGFKKSAEDLKIEISDLNNSGILGAAALTFDQQ
ncbi:MAG TPA: ROK family protein [Hanamia sp.]|nr:ROK family protein [Hanamia sp.]